LISFFEGEYKTEDEVEEIEEDGEVKDRGIVLYIAVLVFTFMATYF
jgi:hypothetical protein